MRGTGSPTASTRWSASCAANSRRWPVNGWPSVGDVDARPFADIASFTALPRPTDLALSHDGTRLVATMQQPDAKGARYVSSLWQIPLDDAEPLRLTRSEKGESAPAFLPDGSLLFVSARPDDSADEEPA